MRRFILFVAIVAALLCNSQAQASNFFLEPEIGIKGFTADAGDTFDSGFSIGGTLGYHVSPRFALTAHGDFAGHDINGD